MYGDSRQGPLIKKLVALLSDPKKGLYSVGQAAREIGLSVSTLQHELKKCGTRFTKLVRKRRADCFVDKLLAEPEKTVEEVARDCGYEPQTAYRHCKAVYGKSPREIRKKGFMPDTPL